MIMEDGGEKAVWKKVVNEVSPLMGVAAWPALCESTKAASQGTGNNTNTNPSSYTPAARRRGTVANPNNNMTTNGGFSSENPQRGGSHQQRGTGGPHPRGNALHYPNHGNQHRNPHRRGAHMQPQRGSSRPFVRGPPHPTTSYVPPLFPVHPSFATPMVYPSPEVFYIPGSYPDPFRAGPMLPPMGPLFYSFVDPLLQTKIVNQIEYYFSTENLVGDTYLRKNMDEQGWVSIKLIAGFKKVSQLTDNVQLILAALQASRLVEVEGEKLRRRDDWERWILPPAVQHTDVSSPHSVDSSGQERLAVQLQNVALDESSVRNVDHGNHSGRSSPGEFNR
ncbi:RNA metabolism protein [Lithospermum erythrorhizon]|uniref:RNA metabolism protein n=1 Tax=Lithospermum erythrorhizon TaxID=34254 RepID=A0AAV3Q7L0_LITER